MNKITKEEFELLYDENVAKKKYDEIISKIEKRFSYIFEKIIIGKHHFAVANFRSGYFNLERYKEEIEIDMTWVQKIHQPYNKGNIPTRWLWEDFEDEYKSEVKKYATKREAKIIKAKEEREKLLNSVRQKVTEEEWKALKIKI